MKKTHYFDGARITPREHTVLGYLALGESIKNIRLKMGITDENCRVIIVRLMAKTGALDRANKIACQACLDACTQTAPAKPKRKTAGNLTVMQSAVLAEVMKRKLFYEIAKSLGITHSTAKSHFYEGLKRLGLTGLAGDALRAELGKFFTTRLAMDDPAFN